LNFGGWICHGFQAMSRVRIALLATRDALRAEQDAPGHRLRRAGAWRSLRGGALAAFHRSGRLAAIAGFTGAGLGAAASSVAAERDPNLAAHPQTERESLRPARDAAGSKLLPLLPGALRM